MGGTSNIHTFWYPIFRLCPTCDSNVLHHCISALLPAYSGGSPLVVDVLCKWWNDWFLYLWVFILFLLSPKWFDWFPPNLFLLWIHGSDLIRIFPDVGKCQFSILPTVREIYLFTGKMRLIRKAKQLALYAQLEHDHKLTSKNDREESN